jgi:hypothetical protein
MLSDKPGDVIDHQCVRLDIETFGHLNGRLVQMLLVRVNLPRIVAVELVADQFCDLLCRGRIDGGDGRLKDVPGWLPRKIKPLRAVR